MTLPPMSNNPNDDDEPAQRGGRYFHPHVPRQTVESVMQRLGYDVYDQDDMNKLAETLRFAEHERKRRENFDSSKMTWLVSGLLTAFGASMAILVQWLEDRWHIGGGSH